MTIAADRPTTTDWIEVAADVGVAAAAVAGDHDRSGEFVSPAFDRLGQVGLLGAPVPTELGGGGADYPTVNEILRTLGRSCGSTAVTLSMHYHLVCTQVWRWKHDLPAETILRRVAAENLVLVSTGASDWLGSNGTVRRVDGGYRVSARKTPSSGAPVGDVLVTSFRWDDGPEGVSVIHCSVPFTAEGVSIDETWDTMGLRATGSHTVVLHDVFVPDAAVALVRPADVWHPVWNAVLGTALPLIMSAYLGITDAAVAEATTLARGKAEAPHVAPLVGTMGNHHTAAADAVAAMIRAADDLTFDNTDAVADAALARKTNASQACEAAVRTAVEVAGGAGFHRSFPIERLYRDVLGGGFHPLPGAKQVRLTGRRALGLDPAG